jgi:hypothetical protein
MDLQEMEVQKNIKINHFREIISELKETLELVINSEKIKQQTLN